MKALAVAVFLALLVALTVAACNDPNAPASPTPVELDVHHHYGTHTKPRTNPEAPAYRAPKAPSYRKPSKRRR